MLTQLTKKPGEFKAHCRLRRWVDVDEVLAVRPDAEGAFQGRWNDKLERSELRMPCAFETTDRAAFDEHMKLHADDRGEKRTLMKLSGPPIPVPVRMWKLPTAPKPLNRETIERTQTCPTCGLVAQVEAYASNTNAGELWWDEHLRGCALDQAGAAS